MLDIVWNILVTFREIEYFGQNNYGDICEFIRDTYLYWIFGYPMYKPHWPTICHLEWPVYT